MTVRIKRTPQNLIDDNRIAALITQSILLPTDDDAPNTASSRPAAAWIGWATALSKPSAKYD